MGLISSVKSYFLGVSSDKVINQAIKVDAKRKVTGRKQVFKRVKHKGLEYNGDVSTRGATFKPPEYNLNQIAAIMDIDSYLRRAVEKYVELILKNGFDFVGKNPSTIKYIKKRFEQISLVTSIPTCQLFEDICQQLVAYSNCFISKVRNEKGSGGKVRKTFYGKTLKPVAGYFVEDATSIYIAKDENGNIKGYQQRIQGASKWPEWTKDNMVHIYYSRKRGLSFGTPFSFPVIDDIKALRKIEQNIEVLSHQHTIPIIHYKIGDTERPGSPEEVIAVKDELEGGAPYGCVVTTNRHEITGIDVKTNASDADKLANIFKMRIYAGLGVSPMVMGEQAGAGRQTAESLDRQMENTAEKFMKVIKTFVDDYMIKELLLEGGYSYDAYDTDNKVELYFPPINLEAKNKMEEHLNNLYQNNLITETEARKKMGYEPFKESERKDLHLNRIQIPLALVSAAEETYTETTTKSPSGAMKKVKKPTNANSPRQKTANKIANTAQPVNQHGKSLARPRVAKDSSIRTKILSHYRATSDDLIMALEDGSFDRGINSIIKVSKDLINKNYEDYLRISYTKGYRSVKDKGLINFGDNIRYSIKQGETKFNNYFENMTNKINSFYDKNSDKIKNISLIHSIFNNYKNNFEKIIDEELVKSYNIGVVQAGLDKKINKFKVSSEDCKLNHKKDDLKIKSIDYTKIPPFCNDCECILYI